MELIIKQDIPEEIQTSLKEKEQPYKNTVLDIGKTLGKVSFMMGMVSLAPAVIGEFSSTAGLLATSAIFGSSSILIEKVAPDYFNDNLSSEQRSFCESLSVIKNTIAEGLQERATELVETTEFIKQEIQNKGILNFLTS